MKRLYGLHEAHAGVRRPMRGTDGPTPDWRETRRVGVPVSFKFFFFFDKTGEFFLARDCSNVYQQDSFASFFGVVREFLGAPI
jgi:hypothetical protein